MTMTLKDISETMQDIDFCMLSTKTAGGELASRPMSNNGEVEYDGDSWFFGFETAAFVGEIANDPTVGLTFSAGKSLLGKPGIFISVAGEASLIRDKGEFAAHWVDDLDRWFPEGIETPGMVMLKVRAKHIHYWDGEDQGEVQI
jgi:general stress protein 26